jgi:hypothetical protein
MPWHCEVNPRWQGPQRKHGVIAPTATRWPSAKPSTAEPSSCTTPTDSWPSPRPSGISIAPRTVCTSEVQIRAAVVRTTASLGPGRGMGFSTTPALPAPRNTSARIVC